LRVMRTAESWFLKSIPDLPVKSAGLFYPMRRILFVKTSSLGDVVHHCPAVSDAARRLPGAQIDWVVEEPFAELAALHAAVRRAIPVALRRWRRRPWLPAVWAEIAAFRRSISLEQYDAVIDTQSLLKSALIGSLARGRKHGMDRASAREPFAARFYDVTHAVPKGLHAVERNRRLTAAALGYPLDGPMDYGLRTGPDSAGVAERPYAVFLTMTSRADKLWEQSRWVDLGRKLGMRIALPWGSERERARAEAIAEQIGNATVPSRMTLTQMAAFLQKAKYVVGVDTGLTHLAAALGCATTGIYCGSDPALTGLYGSPGARNVGAPGRAPAVDEVLKALA
jgi:heptosyltransferase-1